MMVFLLDKITPRWEYTFAFIFGLRDIQYQLTDQRDDFETIIGAKYKIPNSLGKLLNDSSIFLGKIGEGEWQKHKCVSFDGKADVLSSIFFVLTRMEEYSNSTWDMHNRFSAKLSWQYQQNCLEKAVCDRWANAFISFLEKELKLELNSKIKKGELIPSFDIDNAYAFQYKGWKRRMMSNLKDVLRMDFKRLTERRSFYSGKEKDPYDGHEKIQAIAKRFPVRLFWLVGDYGHPDYNIAIETPQITSLVLEHAEKMNIGIHPSYQSNREPDLLNQEIRRLQSVVKKNIAISRQHFLKLRFPETYTGLIKANIKEDYTMGFADAVGFRNGTAQAFPWFDLKNNKRTELIIRPFVYMDGTLNEYLYLSPAKAKVKIAELYDEVQKQGGDFIFLWHNETITGYRSWKGWEEVLDYTLTLN